MDAATHILAFLVREMSSCTIYAALVAPRGENAFRSDGAQQLSTCGSRVARCHRHLAALILTDDGQGKLPQGANGVSGWDTPV
jgi:hypothetical protein